MVSEFLPFSPSQGIKIACKTLKVNKNNDEQIREETIDILCKLGQRFLKKYQLNLLKNLFRPKNANSYQT